MKQYRSVWVSLAVLAMLCVNGGPAVAQGSAAEERYIVARDLAVTNFTSEKIPDVQALTKAEPDEKRARADLDRQMRAIIGPVQLPGLGAAKFNLVTLFAGEMGVGLLDGLHFGGRKGSTAIIVTTRWLMTEWARKEKKGWERLEEAFRDEGFYTHAIDTDAAIVRFAEIPLDAGTEKPAFAFLAGRTQDQMPAAPDEVFVAAVKGERAFIAYAPLKQRITAPACTAAHRAAEKRLNQTASTEKAREENDAIFLKCFAERAPKHAHFAEAVKQAKALYDRMPVR
jgi:hypothetical protein